MANTKKLWGTYRGTVVSNADPMLAGRLLLRIPDALGSAQSVWAARCIPLAGQGKGVYVIPEAGDEVLVAFERGDPRAPVVLGSLWNAADSPPEVQSAKPPESIMVLEGKGRHELVIRELPGPLSGIMLKSAGGAMILINDVAITITNGQGASIVLEGANILVNGRSLP